jgi:hypothetical protein
MTPNRHANAEDDPLEALRQMVEQLDHAALAEVERAARLTVLQKPSPSEERRSNLAALRSLLAKQVPDPALGFPVVMRRQYDEVRPPGAPSSERLVQRHGSWTSVCYIASGLTDDGHWRRSPRGWTPAPVQRKNVRRYTREDVLVALQHCAADLQRYPSGQLYEGWAAVKRRRARAAGEAGLFPSRAVVYRFFPRADGGWTAAVRAAGVAPDWM